MVLQNSSSTKKRSWRRYKYIFVGGYHFSGTTISQSLLASQEWGLGLKPGSKRGRLPQCARLHCSAPEGEGVFLTKAYHSISDCHPTPWDQSGRCAAQKYNKSIEAIDTGAALKIRDAFWHDWSPFWRGCTDTIEFLIAKDIPVLYFWPILATAFGKARSSFIFTIRHPLDTARSRGQGYKNRIWSSSLFRQEAATTSVQPHTDAEFIHWWLTGYRIALEAATTNQLLERVCLFQLERLREDPRLVLEYIAALLGIDYASFEYDYQKKLTSSRRQRRLGIHRSSINRNGRVTVIALDPRTKTTEITWNFKQQSDHDHFLVTNNEIRSRLCYDLTSLAPLREGKYCAKPILAFRKLRDPVFEDPNDIHIPRCAWTSESFS